MRVTVNWFIRPVYSGCMPAYEPKEACKLKYLVFIFITRSFGEVYTENISVSIFLRNAFFQSYLVLPRSPSNVLIAWQKARSHIQGWFFFLHRSLEKTEMGQNNTKVPDPTATSQHPLDWRSVNNIEDLPVTVQVESNVIIIQAALNPSGETVIALVTHKHSPVRQMNITSNSAFGAELR